MSDDLFTGGLPAARKSIIPLTMADFREGADGVFRVPDWRLAEALAFNHTPEIRRLIERHRSSLEQFGNLWHGATNSRGPGRPGSEYLLNFNQVIFIIIKSEAPNAIPVQIHVVEIYGLWARGDLKPKDEATAVAVAESTARVEEQAPALLALIQEMLSSLTDTTGAVGDRVASVQRTALEIQDRLNDIVKRRPAPVRNQDIYDQVLLTFYSTDQKTARCPCCGEHNVIKDGKRNGLYTQDHATDNAYKNSLFEMWPVCKYCNSRLRNDPLYRSKTMDAFRNFQRHVEEITGERLI